LAGYEPKLNPFDKFHCNPTIPNLIEIRSIDPDIKMQGKKFQEPLHLCALNLCKELV